jgi:hypothetical protein
MIRTRLSLIGRIVAALLVLVLVLFYLVRR